jgi:hypothetical protein
MLNRDVRPSTLQGVKRLATQIRIERGISHTNALDLAAQAANCANYRHAQSILPAGGRQSGRHVLFLTIYWFDRENNSRCGRETLKVGLSKPVLDLCSKSDLKLVRGFDAMRMAAPDHFVSDTLAHSQSFARNEICKAVRSLRFMEHTGLRPSRDYRAKWPDRSEDSKLPNSDHSTNWVEPVSGRFIFIDEPYSESPNAADRAAWAQEYGWWLRKSSWPGMYYPHHCDLYVATKSGSGYDFDALVEKIDAIPKPLIEEDWAGESAPIFDVFVSPAATTPQDRRRARSKATIIREASATTIPYGSLFGSSRRRPAGAMPLGGHIEMGRIIKAVIHSSHAPPTIDQRMNKLRSTLEDWLACEIGPREHKKLEFVDIYYRDPDREGPYAEAAHSRSGLIRILDKLRKMLESAYPACAPLSEQVRRIDVSVSLIRRMKATTN